MSVDESDLVEELDSLSFPGDKKVEDLSDEEWDELVDALDLGTEELEILFKQALSNITPNYCPNCGEEL